ncbi:hypothetical protein DM50_2103 [Burkholderia mallei]|nr:hypothetical protein DM50_2103 [Burkholderia mallei]
MPNNEMMANRTIEPINSTWIVQSAGLSAVRANSGAPARPSMNTSMNMNGPAYHPDTHPATPISFACAV